MEKLLFLSLLAFAILLVSCEQNEVQESQRAESPELDAFVFTEQFDTLICNGPEVCLIQHVKDANTTYNYMEIQCESWSYGNDDYYVKVPTYLFYFLSPQSYLDYLPSGVYSFSVANNQPWSIKKAERIMYFMDTKIGSLSKASTEELKQCCMEITKQEHNQYNIQVWMEMTRQPYFRYVQLNKVHLSDDIILLGPECNWWHMFN